MWRSREQSSHNKLYQQLILLQPHAHYHYMCWSILINVFLPPCAPIPWTDTRRADLFMPLFSTFLRPPKWHFFVYCVGSVEMLLLCWWFFVRMISAQENASNPRILWRENNRLFCQCCCLLELRALASLSLSFAHFFPHLCFSDILSVLFCLKQTHICAVRVMVATSEGSVLGLYLELWPSRSAVVPARSTLTESPANPAHHKALVRIFKSLHPLHIWSHLLPPDTQTQTHSLCLIQNTPVKVRMTKSNASSSLTYRLGFHK